MRRADPVAGLLDLLARERAALLDGSIAALPSLVAGKERLADELAAGESRGAADLSRLRAAAQTNEALLAAALRGIADARARLEILRDGGPALTTYDARGVAQARQAGPRVLGQRI
jgi:hypothetical protein